MLAVWWHYHVAGGMPVGMREWRRRVLFDASDPARRWWPAPLEMP